MAAPPMVEASITEDSPRVVFVDEQAHELELWTALLEGARLDQEHLVQFAALARAARASVVKASDLAVPMSVRVWARLVAAVERLWLGDDDELPPVVSVTRAFARSRAESRA